MRSLIMTYPYKRRKREVTNFAKEGKLIASFFELITFHEDFFVVFLFDTKILLFIF